MVENQMEYERILGEESRLAQLERISRSMYIQQSNHFQQRLDNLSFLTGTGDPSASSVNQSHITPPRMSPSIIEQLHEQPYRWETYNSYMGHRAIITKEEVEKKKEKKAWKPRVEKLESSEYNKRINFGNDVPYLVGGCIDIYYGPTSNCQLSILGQAHYLLDIKNNKEKKQTIISTISKYTSHMILIDIKTKYKKDIIKFFNDDAELMFKNDYISTNGSRMTLIQLKWKT